MCCLCNVSMIACYLKIKSRLSVYITDINKCFTTLICLLQLLSVNAVTSYLSHTRRQWKQHMLPLSTVHLAHHVWPSSACIPGRPGRWGRSHTRCCCRPTPLLSPSRRHWRRWTAHRSRHPQLEKTNIYILVFQIAHISITWFRLVFSCKKQFGTLKTKAFYH